LSDTTVAEAPALTADALAEKFIALRNRKAEMEKAHKEALAPYNLGLEWLENQMLAILNETGAESMRTKSGTFFKTTKTSVTVNRWSDTLDWIQKNERWELLEARVNKTMTLETLKELAETANAKAEAGDAVAPEELEIPGVHITTMAGLNVRSS